MKRVLLGVLALLLAGLVLAASPRALPDTGPLALPTHTDPEAFLSRRLAESEAAGAWPQARERLVRHHEGRAPEAYLYIHGFGATRAEGEAVMDPMAADRGANLYYLRLPGHGTDMDDHAAATPADYLETVRGALGVMDALGERVVVVGTSTGGLLATWLAATFPRQVDALILASPLYDFGAAWIGPLLRARGGLLIAKPVLGDVRNTHWEGERKVEGYDDHWLLEQRYEALVNLEQLRRVCTRDEVISAVSAPTLALYHYASESEQDTTISVPAVEATVRRFSSHPATRTVAIGDGAHVLMSEYVRTDKARVRQAMHDFLHDVMGPPVGP